jgi:7-cyano-7-deazaguanine synthase
MSRAYVLLSGGIDSTTCFYIARSQFDEVIGVSAFYGQRHKRELEYARKLCDNTGRRHVVLNLSGIIPKTSLLTDKTREIPNISYGEIDGLSPAYVPFRNGLLIASVASFASGERVVMVEEGAEFERGDEWAIFFGAHSEDAQNWAYPDCTPEFIGGMANAVWVGSDQTIRLHTPIQWLDKEGIIKLGTSLDVDWAETWSCYQGDELHCGTCPTCRARREGFNKAGVPDPTQYADSASEVENIPY